MRLSDAQYVRIASTIPGSGFDLLNGRQSRIFRLIRSRRSRVSVSHWPFVSSNM